MGNRRKPQWLRRNNRRETQDTWTPPEEKQLVKTVDATLYSEKIGTVDIYDDGTFVVNIDEEYDEERVKQIVATFEAIDQEIKE